MVPNPIPTDAIKEVIAQETSVREYVAPYPTPLEPAPRQRPLGSADARPLESRPLEPRPLEPRHIEPRYSEQRPVEPSSARPRPMHATATRHVYEDPHTMETQRLPQPRPVPSHQLHHQGRQDVAVPDMAHTRPDAKRKIMEFSAEAAHDEANFKHYAKRPRTQEMPSADMSNGSMAPTAKQSPRINQPSQIPIQRQADRTVTFDEIYQNGKAQYKHKIFEWKAGSGNWYIVRCDDHQVHFGFKNPIHGAAKHMHSPQHGNLEKRHDLAIEICGHRVLGCNAELAEINNREFERALREDRYRVFNRNLLTKDGRRRLCGDQSPVLKKEPLPTPPKVVNEVQLLPQEGKFYQGLWAPNKKWYMLIVLPIRPDGSLREVGLREKLQETQLMSNVPKCYRVDRVSLLIKGFQPAYEDGGPKVDKREYPVMFFDGHQRHSLGWLPAQRLREVNLDNPPESVDKRGLSIAREWYSQHMMHRKDWEEFKNLGPGEPSSSAFEEDSGQWPSLRSAHTDNQSPIQDRPGHFGFGSASGSGSDDEDTMMADIGPASRSQDTSRDTQSPSEGPDKQMQDGSPHEAGDSSERAASHLSRLESTIDQTKSKSTSRPSSQHGPLSETKPITEPTSVNTSKPATGKDEETKHEDRAPQENDSARTQCIEQKATSVGSKAADNDDLSSVLSEQEMVRRNAQVKAAAAAVMEAASHSRASSEVPESTPKNNAVPQQSNGHGATTQSAQPPRPALSEHQRSKSDDLPRSEAEMSRKPSDLHSILNAEHSSPQQQKESKERAAVDPYKQFEAIKAQMALDGLKNRPASAPASESHETASAFTPPARASHSAAALDVGAAKQHSPSTSHAIQLINRRPESDIRSPSTASVQSGDSDAESDEYWGRYGYNKKPFWTGPSAAPHVSHVKRAEVQEAQSSTAKELPPPIAQLGTPIAAEMDNFEVMHFSDTARGLRWTRENVKEPLLRLKVDEMRGWAETPGGSPLKAAVEPLKVSRIEVDAPTTDKNSSDQNKLVLQQVHLTLKNGHTQTLVFEQQQGNRWATAIGPCLQGRQFAAWVKKWNGEAEYRQESSV